MNREHLYQAWVHSHEEDTPTEEVFRPAKHPFPPSRGRRGFELHRDGSLTERTLGPADAPGHANGRWDLHDDEMNFESVTGARVRRKIVALEPDRLVLKRSP